MSLSLSLLLALAPVAGPDLACWTRAAGGTERLAAIPSVHRQGRLHSGGIEGTFESWSRADGAWRLETELGPTRRVLVFDGRTGWVQDGSSRARELGGPELAQVVSDAYLDSWAALVPGRLMGTSQAGAGSVELRPEGGESIRVELDPATCLPLRASRRQADRTLTTTFSSWQPTDGMPMPAVVVQSTGDARYDTRFEVASTRLGGTLDASLFAAPATRLAPTIEGGAAVADVPVELGQNHVYVSASVNGKPGSSFVLDTGAEVSVMDAGHAAELGLTGAGAVEARGVGEASIDAGMIASPTLGLGTLRAPLEAIYTIPLRPVWQRAGRPLHGILGYDVLGHFVVEVDYAGRHVRFHDPARFVAPKDAAALPFTYDANMPAISTVVEMADGRKIDARMTVDTGASGALTLSSPFVEQHHLREAAGRLLSGTTGRGVAGASKHDLGRIAALHLGPWALKAPVTAFSRDEKGAAASPDVHGNIGGEVLRRFTVFVDYPRRTMYLRPNAALAQPFRTDASGAQVIHGADMRTVVVESVLPGTPAAEAGLREGDAVVSIDGRSADGALYAMRDLLREPGKTYAVVVMRAGRRQEIRLTTRPLF